MYKKNNAI